ncbi:DNA methylase N-4 [Phyllobacterium phragmitis]|uniref:site-specific DNA-methyltransferase (adenine-specific) n=1 Tax=Phyllobacterium phragmitis TaxID=2670329 RepID=A0A2S9IPN0_9HYPH|nr:DNA methylase N-4 [Phyllobacterium phragmitis]
MRAYQQFLEAKAPVAKPAGLLLDGVSVNALLKPHQDAIVRWAVNGGCRAIFAAFGLGKTNMQLETVRCVIEAVFAASAEAGFGLIVAPLGVRQEFMRDAATLGTKLTFIRSWEEAVAANAADPECRIFITNYETVRDGKIDPALFLATSLDEASCLRGFGGTKIFREFMRLFQNVRYKFVATATPSPNDYIELLAYAAYLGIMDVGEAKTRFFKRNSEKADQLVLHPHKEDEFWLWVSSWAIFLQKPSDLGFSDEGYDLPPMQVHWHEVKSDIRGREIERSGQHTLFRDAALGVVDAAREKRDSLKLRVDKMKEILTASPDDHFILWHDLEDERRAIEVAVCGVRSVYGAQDLAHREATIIEFSEGEFQHLAAKPVIAGSGCNFQRHCHKAIFLGIGFKFNDFIQAIHRILRFLQDKPVEIHIIFTENEREVRRKLVAKWKKHEHLVEKMSEIIRKYRLNEHAMAKALERSIGVERIEVRGDNFTCINNDNVIETHGMEENSVGLIVTSIPFSTQYEYTPSYNDFGHTDDDPHFWAQMDFLTPQLLRVLQPGRWACIHVKDRVIPGGLTGLGFQTLSTFHCDTIQHFRKHGFAFMGMKTIITDVVRENNQTYRLGWTEQCKDATKMGCGTPEYMLLFRKPQTDKSRSYADVPVVKAKKEWLAPALLGDEPALDEDGYPIGGDEPILDHDKGQWKNEAGYSRARWQIDAHAFARSSGERLLTAQEIQGIPAGRVFKIWKAYNLQSIYDFEHHVMLAEGLEMRGALPPTFMLMPPHSNHDDVWSDVTRMLTLNGAQHAKGKEMHLCPLQFDIVDRPINQLSNPGDLVLDPFGGLMTVPYRALKFGRRGVGIELNSGYFLDGVAHCKAMEAKMAMPSMFDYLGVRDEDPASDQPEGGAGTAEAAE